MGQGACLEQVGDVALEGLRAVVGGVQGGLEGRHALRHSLLQQGLDSGDWQLQPSIETPACMDTTGAQGGTECPGHHAGQITTGTSDNPRRFTGCWTVPGKTPGMGWQPSEATSGGLSCNLFAG